MDDSLRNQLQKYFELSSFKLSSKGSIQAVYIIHVNVDNYIPITYDKRIPIEVINNHVLDTADMHDAEGIIFISEIIMTKHDFFDPEMLLYLQGKSKKLKNNGKHCLALVYCDKYGNAKTLIGDIITSPNGVRYIQDNKWICNSVNPLLTAWR